MGVATKTSFGFCYFVRSTHIKVDIMSLPDTMMAVVVHGKEDYRMEEVPVPRPGPGEVLVKVEAVGICAGDAKTFTGAERFWGNGADVPQYVEPPVIPGHEFSGRVVALGEGAAELHGVAIGNLTDEINKLSGGLGCDVYIEATGAGPSVKQGLSMLARMGRFVEFSVFGRDVTCDWSVISDTKELTIVGGHLGPKMWPKAIAMI